MAISESCPDMLRSLPNSESAKSPAWGFAEVLPDKVTILAETAERPTEIDVARAQKAKAQAEQILKTPDANTDYPRTLDALARAENRIGVAGKPE